MRELDDALGLSDQTQIIPLQATVRKDTNTGPRHAAAQMAHLDSGR